MHQHEHPTDTTSSDHDRPAATPPRAWVRVTATCVAIALVLTLVAGSLQVIVSLGRRPSAQDRSSDRVTYERLSSFQPDDPEPSQPLLAERGPHDPTFSFAKTTTPSDDAHEPLAIPDIAKKAGPAVVAITTDVSVKNFWGDQMHGQTAGSGFILTPDGYIATNAHVVESASGIRVTLDDGRSFDAKIVGRDAQTDLAVIKIDAHALPVVTLGDSDKLVVGELAVAIGNAAGWLSGTVTSGIISALNRQMSDFDLPLIQTNATINSGNSGGVLLNHFGQVIGINTMKIAAEAMSKNVYEGLNFAIPINEAKPVLEALIREGTVKRPLIGIETRTISEETARFYKDLTPGVLVRAVKPKSAAARAGVAVGDIIVAFNGQKIRSTADLFHARNKAPLDRPFEVNVVRNGQTLTLNMTLTSP